MQVHRIYTFSYLRNFTYLIEDGFGGAYCVDPFDAAQVKPILKKHKLKLVGIINTHEHDDHTCGNKALVEEFLCPVYAPRSAQGLILEMTHPLDDDDEIQLKDTYLKVIDIPGHTFSHLGLLLIERISKTKEKTLAFFSGDTVFNGGVGRCSNGGDPEILFDTIENKISHLKGDILLYPGHDYYINNLKFTLSIEKENQDAVTLLKDVSVGDSTEFVTDLSLERKINTFFRLEEETVRSPLGMLDNTSKEIFLELRKKRDQW